MGDLVRRQPGDGAPPTASEDAARRGALLLAPEAGWVRPPGSPWHDLRERHPVRRMLFKLIEHRREAPGRGLSLDELQEAGWPGERILPDAAANRIHVGMTQLRKLGLKAFLRRGREGYFLDPALPIELLDGAPRSVSPEDDRARGPRMI